MNDEDAPKYACPHCGAGQYCAAPDSYSIFEAANDRLYLLRTELADDELRLHCRECGAEAPKEFLAAAAQG